MSIQIQRNGTWQEVSKQEFLDLVNKGVIRPETEVIVGDKKAVAAKIKGIVFPSNVAVPPPQPATAQAHSAAPAPFPNWQVARVHVESLKERVIQQIDKLPIGRKPLAIGGAALLILVGGWWMMGGKTNKSVHMDDYEIIRMTLEANEEYKRIDEEDKRIKADMEKADKEAERAEKIRQEAEESARVKAEIRREAVESARVEAEKVAKQKRDEEAKKAATPSIAPAMQLKEYTGYANSISFSPDGKKSYQPAMIKPLGSGMSLPSERYKNWKDTQTMSIQPHFHQTARRSLRQVKTRPCGYGMSIQGEKCKNWKGIRAMSIQHSSHRTERKSLRRATTRPFGFGLQNRERYCLR